MSGQPSPPSGIDHSTQLEKYRHRERLIRYVSGGLAGIALIGPTYVSSSAFIDENPWIRAVFLSLVLVTGLCLGLSYAKYENAAEILKRRIAADPNLGPSQYDRTSDPHRPGGAEAFYRWGTIGVLAAGIWLLVTVLLETLWDS